MTGRGPTDKVLVERRDIDGWRRVPDEVVVEEPMEIRLDDNLVATTMRTPGHDFELAAGLCHADGLLGDAAVHTIRYCGTGPASETGYNVVSVDTGGRAPIAVPRIGNVSSSCGLCGSVAIDDLRERLRPLSGTASFAETVVIDVVDRVRAAQELFLRTGGLHAAAAFDVDGDLVVVREDIGRHNAVDKVVGRLLLDDRLPASDLGLFVSGRASFEMVQKAWAGGFGTVVAVSAPSALAIEAARRAEMTLIGFARGDELGVYAGAVERGCR